MHAHWRDQRSRQLADDGPGLPAAVRKQLFRAGVPSAGGNGVGLSIARDIGWRLGTPHNLWEPALWEITSSIVVVALVPLARYGLGKFSLEVPA